MLLISIVTDLRFLRQTYDKLKDETDIISN